MKTKDDDLTGTGTPSPRGVFTTLNCYVLTNGSDTHMVLAETWEVTETSHDFEINGHIVAYFPLTWAVIKK